MRMRKFYTLFLLGLISLQALAEDDIPVYCLDNEKVAGYFSTPAYDPNDYSYTYIRNYCYDLPWNWKNYGKGERLDQPLPAKVKLTNSLAVEGTLYVSENEDYSDALVKSMANGTDSIDVYNLIPNRTYNWKVVNSATGVEIESGKFKTTGHVRMLKIDGIFNVRDMGGWIGLGGKPIKYGKIIRGSRLNVNSSTQKIITPDGIDELLRLGIRAELDMRDQSNAPMAGGGPRHSYLGDDIPIANIDGAYNSRIATFADAPQSIQGIKQMIAWFKEDRPVYLHCSVGADRTGTVAYLVGALCGMSEDALAREFELTSFSGDSVDNEADRGTWEILVRQRTDVGRLDKCSSPESYKFSDMVAKIKSFPGETFQKKVYNHLREGVNNVSISPEDLAFLVKYLTDYSILAGFNTDVDTIRLEMGDSHKIQVAPFPEDAVYSKISFKSTSNGIATVTDDGTVTAVSGGEAYIIVDVDGIEKYVPVIVPVTDESVVSISLANEYVERYLSEVDYSGDDSYTVSYIEKYDTMTSSVRKDWATQVVLKWTSIGGITKQRLYVSEYPDFSSCFVDTELGDKDSLYRFENLLPDRIYYYKITATVSGASKVQLLSSAFKTTGLVRMLRLRSGYNIRDLGGWTGLGGHKVKYGVLFRGCRLLNNKDDGGMVLLSGEDMSYLMTKLGVNAELDLRNDNETDNKKSVLYPRRGTYDRIKDASLCQGENILSGDAYIKALKSVIEWTMAGKVVYMSGVLGIERTGTMSFLINGLLGVDEDGLSKDYELSSFSNERNEKTDDNILCKRSEGDFPAMVAKIKTLEGETLQQKIYNYFKEGINGTSISAESLDGFICYMLNIDEEELNDIKNDVKPIKRPASVQGGTFNVLGQEVPVSGQGMYIMDGKTVYVTE